MITYQDVIKVPPDEIDTVTVGEVMSRNVVVVYPEETASEALRRLFNNKLEQLPVVDAQHPQQLVGIITHSDLVHGHEAAKMGISRRRVASVLDRVHVEEVMRRDIDMIDADEPVSKVVEKAGLHTHQRYPVMENGKLVGMITVR
jgi:CBS domain-containing protein